MWRLRHARPWRLTHKDSHLLLSLETECNARGHVHSLIVSESSVHQTILCTVRQRLFTLLYFPSGREVKAAVRVQQGTEEEREAGQVGIQGCNSTASMSKTKSKVPRSYTIPVRKVSVHPGSPRAEWTFPGTNPRISPEIEACKLDCVL